MGRVSLEDRVGELLGGGQRGDGELGDGAGERPTPVVGVAVEADLALAAVDGHAQQSEPVAQRDLVAAGLTLDGAEGRLRGRDQALGSQEGVAAGEGPLGLARLEPHVAHAEQAVQVVGVLSVVAPQPLIPQVRRHADAQPAEGTDGAAPAVGVVGSPGRRAGRQVAQRPGRGGQQGGRRVSEGPQVGIGPPARAERLEFICEGGGGPCDLAHQLGEVHAGVARGDHARGPGAVKGQASLVGASLDDQLPGLVAEGDDRLAAAAPVEIAQGPQQVVQHGEQGILAGVCGDVPAAHEHLEGVAHLPQGPLDSSGARLDQAGEDVGIPAPGAADSQGDRLHLSIVGG